MNDRNSFLLRAALAFCQAGSRLPALPPVCGQGTGSPKQRAETLPPWTTSSRAGRCPGRHAPLGAEASARGRRGRRHGVPGAAT